MNFSLHHIDMCQATVALVQEIMKKTKSGYKAPYFKLLLKAGIQLTGPKLSLSLARSEFGKKNVFPKKLIFLNH